MTLCDYCGFTLDGPLHNEWCPVVVPSNEARRTFMPRHTFVNGKNPRRYRRAMRRYSLKGF